MKVKTIIEDRFPKGQRKKIEPYIYAVAFLIELIYNTIAPFCFGFYLARTENLFFGALLVLNILFQIKFTFKDEKMNMELIRGF